MVWFSYLESLDEDGTQDFDPDNESDELFTVQLLTDEQLSFMEFRSSSVEGIAVEIERHEREMRAKRTQMLVDDQIGIDTGITKTIRRLC